MDASLFIRGLLIGLAIAAPVGPIGVLCIRRTLTGGWRLGFVTGLGAATADACYGAVAAFGLAVVSEALTGYQRPIRMVGGVFLLYLAWKSLTAPPAAQAAAGGNAVLWAAYAGTVALTLTNPATILSFVAIFGVAGATHGNTAASSLVVGVAAGSTLWWLFLSSMIAMFRGFLTVERRIWISRLSGLLLLAFGVIAIL